MVYLYIYYSDCVCGLHREGTVYYPSLTALAILYTFTHIQKQNRTESTEFIIILLYTLHNTPETVHAVYFCVCTQPCLYGVVLHMYKLLCKHI